MHLDTTRPFRPRLFLLLALLALLTGCSSGVPPAAVPWSLHGTVWKLVELNHQGINLEKLPALVFDKEGSRVHGQAGVNRFNGTYTLEGASLDFSPLTTTRMAGGEREMKTEQEFLAALDKVTGWRIDANLLILSAGKDEIAQFQALPAGAPL